MSNDESVYRAIDTNSEVIMVSLNSAYNMAVWFLGRPVSQYIVVKSTGKFHRIVTLSRYNFDDLVQDLTAA